MLTSVVIINNQDLIKTGTLYFAPTLGLTVIDYVLRMQRYWAMYNFNDKFSLSLFEATLSRI